MSTPIPNLYFTHIYPGKVERYGGVVLGKNRFNKDISLCNYEISLQFIQLYVYCTCICTSRSKSKSILMSVCL